MFVYISTSHASYKKKKLYPFSGSERYYILSVQIACVSLCPLFRARNQKEKDIFIRLSCTNGWHRYAKFSKLYMQYSTKRWTHSKIVNNGEARYGCVDVHGFAI